jgi:hypothetical protein
VTKGTPNPLEARCASTIVTTPFTNPVRCDQDAYHPGWHHGHDRTSAYVWTVTSYPIGWQTKLDGKKQSTIEVAK